jgi:YARHG domain
MKISILAAATAGLLMSGSLAQAGDICGDLWVQRNQIYKNGGYCFKTTDAIRYFGNAGCEYDSVEDVPLSARERRAVSRIVRQERRNRC